MRITCIYSSLMRIARIKYMNKASSFSKQVITETGLKGTKSRLAIFKLLEEENRPLDVSEIIHGMEESNIEVNQATVYRILDAFLKKGIINRFEFQEGKFRYEVVGDEH